MPVPGFEATTVALAPAAAAAAATFSSNVFIPPAYRRDFATLPRFARYHLWMGTDVLDDVRLLRAREAAALLSVSVRSLDKLVDDGLLRPVRLHPTAHRRFRIRDIAALVAVKED